MKWSGKIEINSQKVNMWCVRFYDLVIDPYFLNQPIIKQENVLNMLLKYAFPHSRAIFQLDGARPHRGLMCKKIFRTQSFQVGWSDTTSKAYRCCTFGFFLLGYVKVGMYMRPINSLNQLTCHIWAPIYMVTNDILTNTHITIDVQPWASPWQ